MIEIVAYFILREGDSHEVTKRRRAYLNWFINSYPSSEFVKEELLYYTFLDYVDKYEAPVTSKALSSFCATELQPLIVKNNIKIALTFGLNFDDIGQQLEAVKITANVLHTLFEQSIYCDYDLLNFVITMDVWINERLKNSIIAMYNDGMSIISSVQLKKTGAIDAANLTFERTASMLEMYSKTKLLEIQEITIDDEEFQFMCNLGITPLDSVTGGLFSTELVSIEAPPGIGKTKFVVCQIMWRSAVLYKKSNLFFALEMSRKEIDALLVARHYYYLYREVVDEANIRIKGNYNKLPNDVKQKIEAARDDLYNNTNYGKIEIQATTLRVDSFIAKIKREDKLKGMFDIIHIDYIGLIESSERKYGQARHYETIGEALMLFKRYVRSTNKLGIAVNQLGAEGTKLAKEGKSGAEYGAQGGMIVYRSTDKNFIISATDEQKAQRKRSIEISKGRGVANLISIETNTKLCMGLFYTDTSEIQQ